MKPQDIKFLRKRDYEFVRELGAGACGKTVLLKDPDIDELFVCKKYAPLSEEWRQKLFSNFVNEIKVLHRVNHPNIVRIFNFHIYRENFAGFIVMEYIEGTDIHSFLSQYPEQAGSIFAQTVSGFRHLEETQILHRDIRPMNILVRNDGVVKIIDFGFGKEIARSIDFNRSVSLNWWCEVPVEFAQYRYDFSTEVYFVGMLFEEAVRKFEIDDFPHLGALAKMCQRDPDKRAKTFVAIDQAISGSGLSPDVFSDAEIKVYRQFSSEAHAAITKIEHAAQFESDALRIEQQLGQVYHNCLLEVTVPDSSLVLNCFLRGQYFFRKESLLVATLKEFLSLLKGCNKAKKNIIVANLQTKLASKPRYSEALDETVPF
jgi:eukaryotic-like serine/threonine-protein kinase